MKRKKTKNRLVVLFAILFVLMGTQMAFSAPILLDNFNLENGGIGALNYTGFANWTVSNGTVDLIGNGYFDFYPGNGLYVDLDGSTFQAGTLSTKISFAPGTYILSFDLGGNQRNYPDDLVDINMGNLATTLTVASGDPLSLFTYNVTLTTTGPLTFYNHGGDNVGAILDNVTVSAVPEPYTVLLLGLGMVGLAGVRRKFGN